MHIDMQKFTFIQLKKWEKFHKEIVFAMDVTLTSMIIS